jgi:hypothetical protein
MRDWWQDLLIQAGGGLIGTLAAAGVLALAAKAAGLFDAAREFDFSVFFKDVGLILGVLATAITVVTIVIELSAR